MKPTLKQIIENTEIKLKQGLTSQGKCLDGFTESKVWKKIGLGFTTNLSSPEYKIYLNVNTYNLGETLLHEALHIKYPVNDEFFINGVTKAMWDESRDVKNLCSKRIIKLLGTYGL